MIFAIIVYFIQFPVISHRIYNDYSFLGGSRIPARMNRYAHLLLFDLINSYVVETLANFILLGKTPVFLWIIKDIYNPARYSSQLSLIF